MDPYQPPKSESQYSDGGSISGLLLFERAVQELLRHWKPLLVACAIPILCSALLRLGSVAYFQTLTPPFEKMWLLTMVTWGLGLLSVPFFVLFATNCHRVILMGEDSLPNRFGLYWSYNETRFLGWTFVLGLIAGLVALPVHFIPGILLEFDYYEYPLWIFTYLGMLVSTYFDGRLGLVLPATAVGDRMPLGESWQITKRVGWAIFFALVIPIAITELAEYLLFSQLITSKSLITYFFRNILFYPLIAIGVAIVTVVYRDLGKEVT